ncbi:unnamed protein product [Linum tenue]|uniref:Uncharacterized protein n=1 Tax=Linum tenue TaxID=586396 RepID=A0AAV0ML68_9ROSI|nr:unnamed protein product [Linum tenue]
MGGGDPRPQKSGPGLAGHLRHRRGGRASLRRGRPPLQRQQGQAQLPRARPPQPFPLRLPHQPPTAATFL